MASYAKRTNGDGSKSVLAWVRVKGFNAATKSFPDRAAAKRWAEKLEDTLRDKRKKKIEVRPDTTTLTLKQLIEAYCAEPNVKDLKTYNGIVRLLGWWVDSYGSEKVIDIGPLKLREARALLMLKRRTPATTNRYLSAMRACWNWGLATEVISEEKAWPRLLILNEPEGRKRYLTDHELNAVKAEALKHSAWMYAAVLVSIGCGIRQGEMLRLQWTDLDFENKTLTVLLSKTDKPRRVHLPAPAIEALKKLRRDGVIGRKHVFLNDEGKPADKFYLAFRWRNVRKAASLVNFKWHDLRHTCASFLLQNKASLSEVQSVLGHKSIISTERYAHLAEAKAVTGADKLAEKLA